MSNDGMRYKRLSLIFIYLIILFIFSNGVKANIIDTGESRSNPQLYSPVGATIYHIPIEVPPGRNGMTPEIALTYNSYKKNGWIGQGWDIEIGSIELSTKNGLDRSSYIANLNGKTSELICYEKLIGAGIEYCRVRSDEDFTEYIHHTSSNSYWEVNDRNGTKYYFGQSIESRQNDPEDSTRTYKWCLDKIMDPNGNTIMISYNKEPGGSYQGQIYPDKIEYANIGSSYISTIEFLLDSTQRSDVEVSYHPDFKVVTDRLLQEILISSNGQRVRRYEFGYLNGWPGSAQTDTLLTTVTQYGTDDSVSLPPITFNYPSRSNITNASFFNYAININLPGSSWTGLADFNGDAIQDFWYAEPGTSRVMVFPSPQQNLDSAEEWADNNNWPPDSAFKGFADVNGDGKDDLWYIETSSKSVIVRLSNGSAFEAPTPWTTLPITYIDQIVSGRFGMADFNGDGKKDFWWIQIDNEFRFWVQTAKDNEYGFNTRELFVTFPSSATWYHHGIADLNNDGKVDFFGFSADSSELYNFNAFLSTGDSFLPPTDWTTWSDRTVWGGYEGMQKRIGLSDFNGDGKPDLWYLPQGTNNILVGLSTGSDFEEPTLWLTTSNTINDSRKGFADFDGDGKQDFWYIYYNQLRIHTSTGSPSRGFREPIVRDIGNVLGDDWVGTADINGDAKADFWWVPEGDNSLKFFVSDITSPYEYIETIENGKGGTYSIDYIPSTASQHHKFLPFPMNLVSKITIDDGVSEPMETNFSYEEGFYDIAERDFRGFEVVTKTNPDGTILKEHYYCEDDFLKGKIKEIEFTKSDGTTLTNTIINWMADSSALSDDLKFVHLAQKLTKFFDNGDLNDYTYSQEDYTYYTENGLLENQVTEGDDGERITIHYDYQDYGGDHDPLWCKTSETITGDITGECRTTSFTYDSSGNNTAIYYDTLSEKHMTYDDYGNLETITNGNNHTISYSYDPNYIYPATITYPETNGVSHIVSYPEYDYGFGKVKREINENGIATVYNYDKLGRTNTITINGTIRTDYDYNDTAFPRYTIEKNYATPTETIDTYNFVDGLDRNIQTITTGETVDNSMRYVVNKTQYDNMGRISKVQGPFFGTTPGYQQTPPVDCPYVETVYDDQNRPVETKSPLNPQFTSINLSTAQTLYTYNGLSTTITDPDFKKKTVAKDYLGRVIKITEHGDIGYHDTSYEYNAAGDLIGIINSLNERTVIDYDKAGRKTRSDDLDMGEWQYFYDTNGNVNRVIDAKGQEINYNYDELERLTLKDYPDGTITDAIYTYDGAFNGIGYPHTISNGDVTTTYERYDEEGRIVHVTKTMYSNAYSTHYEYLLDGKIKNITYPDPTQPGYTGDVVNYAYYPKSGLIREVYDNGYPIPYYYARISNYDPSGKIGTIFFGNGIVHDYTYDNASGRLYGFITAKTSDPADDLQRRYYTYTPSGDVTKIEDQITQITYLYYYDQLHRLTREVRIGAVPPVAENYSMTFSYNYEQTGYHAPDSVSLNYNGNPASGSYSYDLNGNMTSGPDLTNPATLPDRSSISWNIENMPTEINHSSNGVTQLKYDGDNVRAKKINQGGAVTYYIGDYYEVINGEQVKYIFAGNLRIAKETDTEKYFYHKDHLGSSIVITRSDASVVGTGRMEYMPFGLDRNNNSQTETNYKFTDQEQDSSTGLYNYDARLYDPGLRMFISPDSIVQDYYNPQSLNRYAYCLNNPLIYTDPNGKSWFHFLTVIPGSTVGWALGGKNPYDAVEHQFAIDVRDLKDPRQDAMARHATRAEDQTWSEAMGASRDYYFSKVSNINTVGDANHTFADIISHWGTPWTPGKMTTIDKMRHYMVNDFILGAATAPISATETLISNVYAGIFGYRDPVIDSYNHSSMNQPISSFTDQQLLQQLHQTEQQLQKAQQQLQQN